MRNVVLLLISCGFSFCIKAQESTIIDSSYASNHYKHRVVFFNQLPKAKKAIVFMGNSITEMGEWQELLHPKKVLNRGISGDVTYGVLARLDDVLKDKPAKLFLLIGVNDMKRGIPVDTIAKTYERIVQKIRIASPKTTLFIQSVLPLNEAMLSTAYKKLSNADVQKLNEKLKALAIKYGCTYLDLHPIFTDEKGLLKNELTQDGIHLWPSAYIHWIAYLKKQRFL